MLLLRCGKFLKNGLVGAAEGCLIQNIHDPSGLPADFDAVVDMDRRQDTREKGGQERHVLRFVGGEAAQQTQSQFLGKVQGRDIVGDQAGVRSSDVVNGSDVSNQRARNRVQEGQLLEGGSQ